LAYLEALENKSLACKREYIIRNLNKIKKEDLVKQEAMK
jgi:predicted GIY-YIG superfamily endonuclease